MRTFGLAVIMTVALSSSPAIADPVPGQVIWSNIVYGMTKDQVENLYPKNRSIDLGNGCAANLRPSYESKKVYEVQLSGSGDNNCNENIFASLQAKYGQPRTEDVEVIDPHAGARTRLPGDNLKRITRGVTEPFDTVRTLTWFTGDTLVTLKLNETMITWSILYQPAEIQKPTLTDKL